jgi:hypothetical protein
MAHAVSLTWNDSIDASSSYNLYRSQTSGLYTTPLNASPLASGTTSFTDSAVTPGTYFYVATSVLNGAESIHSNEAKAVILPAAPTSLVAVGS